MSTTLGTLLSVGLALLLAVGIFPGRGNVAPVQVALVAVAALLFAVLTVAGTFNLRRLARTDEARLTPLRRHGAEGSPGRRDAATPAFLQSLRSLRDEDRFRVNDAILEVARDPSAMRPTRLATEWAGNSLIVDYSAGKHLAIIYAVRETGVVLLLVENLTPVWAHAPRSGRPAVVWRSFESQLSAAWESAAAVEKLLPLPLPRGRQ